MKSLLTTFFLFLIGNLYSQLSSFSKVIDYPTQPFLLEKIINQKSGNDFYAISTEGFIVHLDSNGNSVNSKKYVDQLNPNLNVKWFDINTYTDSTFLVTGRNQIGSTNFGVISEIDLNGEITWSRKIGGSSSLIEFPSISKLTESDFVYTEITNDSTLLVGKISSISSIQKSFKLNSFISRNPFIERLNDSTFCVISKNGNNESVVSVFDSSCNFINSYSIDSISISGIKHLAGKGAICTYQSNFEYNKKGILILDSIGQVEQVVELNNFPFYYDYMYFDIEVDNDSNLFIISGQENYIGTLDKISIYDTLHYQGQVSAEARSILFTNSNQIVLLSKGPLLGIKNYYSFLHTGFNRLDSVNSQINCYNGFGPYSIIRDTINLTISSNTMVEVSAFTLIPFSILAEDIQVQVSESCVDFYGNLDEQQLKEFDFYPNPSENQIEVQKVTEMNVTLQFLDLNGVVLKEISLLDGINKINITDLTKGTYFLRQVDVQDNVVSKTKMLLKY